MEKLLSSEIKKSSKRMKVSFLNSKILVSNNFFNKTIQPELNDIINKDVAFINKIDYVDIISPYKINIQLNAELDIKKYDMLSYYPAINRCFRKLFDRHKSELSDILYDNTSDNKKKDNILDYINIAFYISNPNKYLLQINLY